MQVLEDWKTLEDELWNYNFQLAQLEKINKLSEKKAVEKNNCGKSGEARMQIQKVGKETGMEMFLY